MADKVSSFLIAFDGQAGDLASILAALKRQVKSDVNELQKTADSIELFKNVQADAQKARAAFLVTKQSLDAVKAAVDGIKAAGGNVGPELAAQLKSAETASRSAEAAFQKQFTTFKNLAGQLKTGGVDLRNLANEEIRLAAAIEQANRAAQLQSGKDLLGLKTLKDVQPQVQALQNAYNQLRASGTLSFTELSAAQARLRQRTAELRTEVAGVGAAFSSARSGLIGFTVAIAGVTAGIFGAAANFRTFAQQVAAIDSIAETTQTEVAKLASGVRQLAITMGVDAVESAKALYEIISSGIPPQNALTVLEQATKAAIAGITDVATAARVGVAVLNGYGLEVTQLGKVYDILFKTVQDGVVTFPELAANIGTVIPAARAAQVPLETLGAAFVVLTRAGIDAPEAATAINRAIIDLSAPAPEASKRLRDLGINLGNFQEVIRQISERKLTLSTITEIIPDQRGSRAVLILAQNFSLLNDEIGRMNEAAGSAQRAYNTLANTPQQQVAKFNAAIKDLSISVGQFVTGSSGMINTLTDLVNRFNALDPTVKTTLLTFGSAVLVLGGFALLLNQLLIPLNLLAAALASTGLGASLAAQGITAASVAVGTLGTAIAGLVGYQLGKYLFDASSNVRQLGNFLGITAGRFVNFVEFITARLNPAVFTNKQAVDQVTAAYQRNVAVLDEMSQKNFNGTTESLVQLNKALTQTRGEFDKLRDSSINTAQTLDASLKQLKANVDTQLKAQEQLITTFQQRLTAFVANLQESVTAATATATSQIALINKNADDTIKALDTLHNNELQRTKETIAAEVDAANKRIAVLKQFGTQVVAAFNAEAKARLDIARTSGENLTKVEQQINADRVKVLQTVVDNTKSHLEKLLALEQDHLNKVKALTDQRRDIELELEDKIRGAYRATLDTYSQYRDKQFEVDEKLSKARDALLAGDFDRAEKFAKQASALADDLAKGVEENGKVIIDVQTAGRNATDDWRRATQILLDVNKQRTEAEQEGAEKTRAQIEEATRLLNDYNKQLEAAVATSQKGIALNVTIAEEGITKTLADLQKSIDERNALIDVQVHLALAETELARLQDELKDGITVNVTARTEKIDEQLKALGEQHVIELDTSKAEAAVQKLLDQGVQLEQIQAKIKTIVDLTNELSKPIDTEHTINSNVGDIQQQINQLKQPTFSVHTIKVVEEHSGGGPVGVFSTQAQRAGFALGGPVFSGRKVPGAGDSDSYPATLESGGYVVRKRASQYYGDGLMSRIAQGFNSGGLVRRRFAVGGIASRLLGGDLTQNTAAQGIFGIKRDASGNLIGQLGPADPEVSKIKDHAERVFSVLLSAAAGLRRSSTGQNLADYLFNVLEMIRASTDKDAITALLDKVESIQQNLLYSIAEAKQFNVPIVMGAVGNFDANAKIGTAGDIDPFDLNASSALFDSLAGGRGGLAEGGAPTPAAPAVGTDTVPALLTPGEWVIKRQSVRRYGSALMSAINNMMVPRGMLERLISPPAPLSRFAEGGAVGAAPLIGSASAGPVPTGGGLSQATININASADSLLSPDNVRRFIVPVIRDIERRSGGR